MTTNSSPLLPPTQLQVSVLDCRGGKRNNNNVDNVDNDNNDCRREKRKKQDSLPGGNSLTRDERKVRRPEPFFAWRGLRSWFVCWLSSWFLCWLSLWCWSSFHPDMHDFSLVSLLSKGQHDPELLYEDSVYKFLLKMEIQTLFFVLVSSPSRVLHVCSSWNGICTSRHRRSVFRYLVARSSTCPWTRWPIMFWILKHYKWYTLYEGH